MLGSRKRSLFSVLGFSFCLDCSGVNSKLYYSLNLANFQHWKKKEGGGGARQRGVGGGGAQMHKRIITMETR